MTKRHGDNVMSLSSSSSSYSSSSLFPIITSFYIPEFSDKRARFDGILFATAKTRRSIYPPSCESRSSCVPVTFSQGGGCPLRISSRICKRGETRRTGNVFRIIPLNVPENASRSSYFFIKLPGIPDVAIYYGTTYYNLFHILIMMSILKKNMLN